MKSRIKIQLAQEFRKKPTKSEKIMWSALRRKDFLGYKFRRQHVIDGYILDFYCPKLKLAVEIDGGIHQRQIQADKERQAIIETDGIKFFRINSEEVENSIVLVMEKLKKRIRRLLRI